MPPSRRPQPSRLTGAEADARRRTRDPLPNGYLTGQEGDRGGGGGESAIAEALMHSALRAGIRKGGLQNSGLLSAASLRVALYRRRWTPASEDRPSLPPKVVQAAVPLVQQGDAGEVARQLNVGREEVGRVKQTAGFTDASELLHDHWASWRLEQQTHRTLKDADPSPGTPLSGLWRTAADDVSVLERSSARDLTLLWFSSASSHDPASSAVESAAIDQLAERHPALWYSLERGLASDAEFDGNLLSARTDKSAALAGAAPNADVRSPESLEQHFFRTQPDFRNPRSDLNLLRDRAEAVMTAEADGLLPPGSSRAMVDDARRSIPRFAKAMDRATMDQSLREHAPEAGSKAEHSAGDSREQGPGRTAENSRGEAAPDYRHTALAGFDELRGYPRADPNQRARAPMNAADARTAVQTAKALEDSRLPRTAREVRQAPGKEAALRGDKAASATRSNTAPPRRRDAPGPATARSVRGDSRLPATRRAHLRAQKSAVRQHAARKNQRTAAVNRHRRDAARM